MGVALPEVDVETLPRSPVPVPSVPPQAIGTPTFTPPTDASPLSPLSPFAATDPDGPLLLPRSPVAGLLADMKQTTAKKSGRLMVWMFLIIVLAALAVLLRGGLVDAL